MVWIIKVFVKDDKLFIDVAGQGSFELNPVEKDKFKLEEAGIELTFDSENNSMKFKQGPFDINLIKE